MATTPGSLKRNDLKKRLSTLNRQSLQRMARENGIKANAKSIKIADELAEKLINDQSINGEETTSVLLPQMLFNEEADKENVAGSIDSSYLTDDGNETVSEKPDDTERFRSIAILTPNKPSGSLSPAATPIATIGSSSFNTSSTSSRCTSTPKIVVSAPDAMSPTTAKHVGERNRALGRKASTSTGSIKRHKVDEMRELIRQMTTGGGGAHINAPNDAQHDDQHAHPENSPIVGMERVMQADANLEQTEAMDTTFEFDAPNDDPDVRHNTPDISRRLTNTNAEEQAAMTEPRLAGLPPKTPADVRASRKPGSLTEKFSRIHEARQAKQDDIWTERRKKDQRAKQLVSAAPARIQALAQTNKTPAKSPARSLRTATVSPAPRPVAPKHTPRSEIKSNNIQPALPRDFKFGSKSPGSFTARATLVKPTVPGTPAGRSALNRNDELMQTAVKITMRCDTPGSASRGVSRPNIRPTTKPATPKRASPPKRTSPTKQRTSPRSQLRRVNKATGPQLKPKQPQQQQPAIPTRSRRAPEPKPSTSTGEATTSKAPIPTTSAPVHNHNNSSYSNRQLGTYVKRGRLPTFEDTSSWSDQKLQQYLDMKKTCQQSKRTDPRTAARAEAANRTVGRTRVDARQQQADRRVNARQAALEARRFK